jgi:undecaprenyl diphosphate synthase
MNIKFLKDANTSSIKNHKVMPEHVAFIPDGNNRWAKHKKLPTLAGHHKGVERVKEIVKHCLNLKINTVSFFAFSSENWQRSPDEVANLMKLFSHMLTIETKNLVKNRIRLKIIGNLEKLNKDLQQKIIHSQNITAQSFDITLIIAINYGGMWDITTAMRNIAHKITSGLLNPEAINAKMIEDNLSTKEFKAPDLLIRTSGEQRISNFMIWQCAYSELYFSNKLWPDFDSNELNLAIADYTNRERRFGMNSTK